MTRRALIAVAAGAFPLAFAGTAGAANYIVLYKRTPSRPTRPDRPHRVENVASTAGYGVRLEPEEELPNAESRRELRPDGRRDRKIGRPVVPRQPAPRPSGLQWDMRQIHTPEAHAVTGGSAAVLAGDIDSGADRAHPDLAPNIDLANSVSCEGGVPDQAPAAWRDDAGHGTHTAGTIAAAANGIGIVGTAPKVRLGIIEVAVRLLRH